MVDTKYIGINFNYYRPETLKEVLKRLQEKGSRILAGGTDLLVRIKTETEKPAIIVEITGVKELHILEMRNELILGALVKLYEIEKNDSIKNTYPSLHEAVKSIGGTQIRNMATLTGNLCNASPGADSAPPLITFGAQVEIKNLSKKGEIVNRIILLEDFFKGPGKTVLEPGDILTRIIVPEPDKNTGSAFKKLSRVNLDISKISCAVFLERDGNIIKSIKIAVGAAAAIPVRAFYTEEALTGTIFNMNKMQAALNLIRDDISPVTDVRSTAEYRRSVAPVLVRDALGLAWKRAGGDALL
ncbi:MAG: xanthine dehydrogenase family protein subunit M [Spirochaetes bacterium]|nr:xanthine dehydrogenase family protein subunit M [Spirochaetota bacterium]